MAWLSQTEVMGRYRDRAGEAQRICNADLDLAQTSLRFIRVEHEGCSQRSEPEAERVRELYRNLLGQRWMNGEGHVRPIGIDDIFVVSPYNMQVNSLRNRMPDEVRVAMVVDKFQAQEAAVMLISITDIHRRRPPRQIEFLFSPQSAKCCDLEGARCLAVITASLGILKTICPASSRITSDDFGRPEPSAYAAGGRPCRWWSIPRGRSSHGRIDSSQIESLGGGNADVSNAPTATPQAAGLRSSSP
jgi:hypothetical protein